MAVLPAPVIGFYSFQRGSGGSCVAARLLAALWLRNHGGAGRAVLAAGSSTGKNTRGRASCPLCPHGLRTPWFCVHRHRPVGSSVG